MKHTNIHIYIPITYNQHNNFFVNHLATHVNSTFKFFADDLKIYLNIRYGNIFVCIFVSDISSYQRDIDTIVHFASSSCGLQLYAEKCPVMRFAVRNLLSKDQTQLSLEVIMLREWVRRLQIHKRIWLYKLLRN